MPSRYVDDEEFKRIMHEVRSTVQRWVADIEEREGMKFMPGDLASMRYTTEQLALELFLLREVNLDRDRKARLAKYRLTTRRLIKA